MSSDFRWNLPPTAIFAHHAPRFCNRQPCRCGPYRNSRPPRATATATSHSERTLCSDSIGRTMHPSASVPPHITRARQCAALPIGRPASLLTTHTGAAACYFRFLEPAQSPPFHWAGPTCPLYTSTRRQLLEIGVAVSRVGLYLNLLDFLTRKGPAKGG